MPTDTDIEMCALRDFVSVMAAHYPLRNQRSDFTHVDNVLLTHKRCVVEYAASAEYIEDTSHHDIIISYARP